MVYSGWLSRAKYTWRGRGISVCQSGVGRFFHIPRKAKRIRFGVAKYAGVVDPYKMELHLCGNSRAEVCWRYLDYNEESGSWNTWRADGFIVDLIGKLYDPYGRIIYADLYVEWE